jgi:hypothetical protein
MKRYDSEEQMHSALEVFLFDTLTDPELTFAADVPQEPTFAEAEAAEEDVFVLKVQGTSGMKEYSVNHLSTSARRNREIAWLALAGRPGQHVSKEELHGRTLLAIAALQRAMELEAKDC